VRDHALWLVPFLIGYLKLFAGQCTGIGRHLAATAPPGASLATTAAGAIPFYSHLYTLDLLGLNDEWIAHQAPTRGHRPGHARSVPESYLLRKEIDYLIYHPTIDARRPVKDQRILDYWQERGYEWRAEQVPGMKPPCWGYWRRIAAAGGG
jgi:hypothetical protein